MENKNTYNFEFRKLSKSGGKTLSNVFSNGSFNYMWGQKDENPFIIFESLDYNQEGFKNPLVFKKVKWEQDQAKDFLMIKNKEALKTSFKQYRDQHRTAQNVPLLMSFERLFFHTEIGLEYFIFSNGPYIPLTFLPDKLSVSSEIPLSFKWVNYPLNIPLEVFIEQQKNENKILQYFGGCVLDEEMLDKLKTDKNFVNKAKPYHFSKNFTVDSNFFITFSITTQQILASKFHLKIEGKEEEILEEMEFEIVQSEHKINLSKRSNPKPSQVSKEKPYQSFQGKDYTQAEWQKYEQEQWDKFKEKK